MTLVTLRPFAEPAAPGDPPVTPSGSSPSQVLRDDSDATFVTYQSGQFSTLALDDLALPAGSILLSAVVRLRVARGSTAWSIETVVNGIAGSARSVWVTWSSPTTVEMTPRLTDGLTDSLLDAASLYVTSSFAALNVYEAYLDVRYVAQPIVTVNAPTGTVTNTTEPIVLWSTVLDADGGEQKYAHVKIFTEAQYTAGGFNPGTSQAFADSGELQPTWRDEGIWPVDKQLPNGNYRAYVRSAQLVNGAQHWSPWAFSAFTINVAVPAAPVVGLSADNAAGRVVLTVDDAAGAATTDAFEVQRLEGSTWVPVRLRDDLEYSPGYLRWAATPLNLYDYEAPNGTSTTYRARAIHDYSGSFDSAGYAAGAWAQAPVTWSSAQWWLKHPLRPALNMPIELFSYSEVVRTARQAAIQPLGATLPVVLSDERAGETGTIIVQARTVAEQDALDALLDTTETLLLQGPAADGHPDRYVRFGDHASARVIDKAWSHITRETLPWLLVAAPAGAQTGDQYTA